MCSLTRLFVKLPFLRDFFKAFLFKIFFLSFLKFSFLKSFFWEGFDLFLFADPHYFRFLIFKFLFLGGFDEKPFLAFLVSGKLQR